MPIGDVKEVVCLMALLAETALHTLLNLMAHVTVRHFVHTSAVFLATDNCNDGRLVRVMGGTTRIEGEVKTAAVTYTYE